ncbi:hypothetical protein ASG11_09030 [Sphingomonas sp. Leaf357]|uniref:ATP-binding protein n=1 Tax=Sphingomonas sp. Leaf357 TaxID=1736350 RepID=UPI0006FBADF6|nr:ATP-binding protein [Sphingomonas sp. Leaf357]KQS04377.1 hypothetical protein ASG11_09030 [Sphingomonas sp. Leaf357]
MSRTNRAHSIAVPIFLLVIASVVAIALVLFTVTFRGPPPRPAPLPLAAIASALRTGADLPPLDIRTVVTIADTAPQPYHPDDERPAATIALLAKMLDHDPADIRLFTMFPQSDPTEVRGKFTAAFRLPDGRWRIVDATRPSLLTSWHMLTLQTLCFALLVLGILAWWVARAISRPLRKLADSAAMARVGVPLSDLPEGGSREVRDLTRSVSAMHRRLAQHAEGRTTMLAAIAHDLGTPLSRLAFRVEQLPDDARARANADIDEMRAMIADALRFARDGASGTDRQRVDLGSLLDSLIEDMTATGAAVSIDPGGRAIVRGDPGALRRLFVNLVENALRYGDRAVVTWWIVDETVEVFIEDDGPGFDPAQAESLFEPFVRGDPSRNRATGGTGLGLAIVRSIAETHGGTVALGSRDDQPGGRVTVKLPIDG